MSYGDERAGVVSPTIKCVTIAMSVMPFRNRIRGGR